MDVISSSCSIWPYRQIICHLAPGELFPNQISLILNLNLRKEFRWIFVVAHLPCPRLGTDFLNHFNLSVDVRKQRLVDGSTFLMTPARASSNTVFSTSFFSAAAGNQFHSIFVSFLELADPTFKMAQVMHHIATFRPHVFSWLWCLAPDRLKRAKVELEHMLQLGLICPSIGPWASPLHLVRKGDSDFKLVKDYCQLNAITIPNHFLVLI